MKKVKNGSGLQGNSVNKARVIYNNGWKIMVPKYGFGPMLFFEYYSNFSADPNLMHLVKNDLDYFIITLNAEKKVLNDFTTYINENL